MWADEEVVAFAEWLRAVNAGLPEQGRVGFYGPDVCFEPYREDPQRYAMATRFRQLARERLGPDAVVLVGARSHRGSVVAAEGWGEPMRRTAVPPARPGSVEHLVHRAVGAVGADCLFVLAPAAGERPRWQAEPLTHRAIGVLYRPEAERWGNYVPTRLADRYDAFLYVDRTAALQPLHLEPLGPAGAQTFPTGV
jgi:erythromycin esterase-like protein